MISGPALLFILLLVCHVLVASSFFFMD